MPHWFHLFSRVQVFAPAEKLENPLLINLVYCQIVLDSYADNCIRMSKDDKRKMTNFIGKTLTAFKSTACLQVEKHLATHSPWAGQTLQAIMKVIHLALIFLCIGFPVGRVIWLISSPNWTASEYSWALQRGLLKVASQPSQKNVINVFFIHTSSTHRDLEFKAWLGGPSSQPSISNLIRNVLKTKQVSKYFISTPNLKF